MEKTVKHVNPENPIIKQQIEPSVDSGSRTFKQIFSSLTLPEGWQILMHPRSRICCMWFDKDICHPTLGELPTIIETVTQSVAMSRIQYMYLNYCDSFHWNCFEPQSTTIRWTFTLASFLGLPCFCSVYNSQKQKSVALLICLNVSKNGGGLETRLYLHCSF